MVVRSLLEKVVLAVPFVLGSLNPYSLGAYSTLALMSCDSNTDSQTHEQITIHYEPKTVKAIDPEQEEVEEQKQLLREANDCGTYCLDKDSDGFGWKGECASGCDLTEVEKKNDYVENADDCNDILGEGNKIFPGAVEICNYLDDNCNGEVDEGFNVGQYCTAGFGICEDEGQILCFDEETSYCDALPLKDLAVPEICTNLLDDNCDGSVNEGCCGDEGEVAPDATCEPYQVVFVLDQSGSMTKHFEYEKQNIIAAAQKIYATPNIINVGLVTFNDDSIPYGFASSKEEFIKWIENVPISHGPIGQEHQLSALKDALGFEWREVRRNIMLITDANFLELDIIGVAKDIDAANITMFGIYHENVSQSSKDLELLLKNTGDLDNFYYIPDGGLLEDAYETFVNKVSEGEK